MKKTPPRPTVGYPFQAPPAAGTDPFQRGVALFQKGAIDEAKAAFVQVLQQTPEHPAALNALGVIHAQAREHPIAADLFNRAIQAKADFWDAHVNLGRSLRELGQHAQSVTVLEAVVKAHPKAAPVLEHLGLSLLAAGQHGKAVKTLKKAVKLAPKLQTAQIALGRALMESGDLKAAVETYRGVLRLAPVNGTAALGLATIKKFKKADDAELAALRSAARTTSANPSEQTQLCFALGKAFDDLGQYDEAFNWYEKANATMKGMLGDYDLAPTLSRFENAARVFDSSFLARDFASETTAAPIFIVGMPRSGTTLVEQILASHPQIHGGGELMFMPGLVNQASAQLQQPYPDYFQDCDTQLVQEIGRAYEELQASLGAGSGKRITDKLPANFQYLGLIHKALPQATIIHCTRDPMDTCLSCYTTLFKDGQQYSYDLTTLGRYYSGYRDIMAHWAEVLPQGRMHTVNYETLIADPESTVRDLLAHCDLSWHKGCLDFHKSNRAVSTASAAQVRRALHGGSIDRWRRYEAQLQPLADLIG